MDNIKNNDNEDKILFDNHTISIESDEKINFTIYFPTNDSW